MSAPSALPDRAVGPPCVPGTPAPVHAAVTRVTAPNPSMMTGPGTNTYVVGDDAVVVIDPGPPVAGHLDAVLGVIDGRSVTGVAVTHHHRDHAPAARSLADQVGAPVVGRGHTLLAVDVHADEGTELAAGSIRLVAWHTPGHASDHLCFLAPGLGWLFTGDHLMQGSTVVIRPPDGNLTAYLRAVERVRDDRHLRRLAPGHGRLLAAPRQVAEEVLAHRAGRAEMVLEALAAYGPATAADLRVFAYADVGTERDEVAVATCWAHLLGLVDDGRATSTSERYDPAAVFAVASSVDGAVHRVEEARRAALRPRGRREVGHDPLGEGLEDPARGTVRPDDRPPLVGVGTERGVEGHRGQQLDAELVREARPAARAEQCVGRAVLALEGAHVLDHPEHAEVGAPREVAGSRRHDLGGERRGRHHHEAGLRDDAREAHRRRRSCRGADRPRGTRSRSSRRPR